MLRYASHTKIFQKKKREKRKPSIEVEGFKKTSFLKKILPYTFYRSGYFMLKTGVVLERFGWRFFSKPEGLELAFLNTRSLVLLSFLSLFYFDK